MFSRLFSGSRAGADPGVIEHDELQKALNEGTCVLVDVREPAEFRAGRIAHSMNLPLSRFDPA